VGQVLGTLDTKSPHERQSITDTVRITPIQSEKLRSNQRNSDPIRETPIQIEKLRSDQRNSDPIGETPIQSDEFSIQSQDVRMQQTMTRVANVEADGA
jgi:hypothetical protein